MNTEYLQTSVSALSYFSVLCCFFPRLCLRLVLDAGTGSEQTAGATWIAAGHAASLHVQDWTAAHGASPCGSEGWPWRSGGLRLPMMAFCAPS